MREMNRIHRVNNANRNPNAVEHLNAAEEAGIAAAVVEVNRVFVPLYGVLPVNLQRFLSSAVRHIFHIIDDDHADGILLENAVLRENGLTAAARSTYNLVERDMPGIIVRPFDDLEFPERLVYINLVIFLYQLVMRLRHQNQHNNIPLNPHN
jgi:hypothetical protein